MARRRPGARDDVSALSFLPARWPFRATLLLLVGLIALVHLPLYRADYVQDDHLAVEENEIVDRGRISEIFSTSYWAGAHGEDRTLFRPTVILSYAWERAAIGRPSPAASHMLNVALHCMVSCLLLLLARRLRFSPLVAAAAALLFAVHPARLEAVANVVGRAEVLAALFSLLALWLLLESGDLSGRAGASPARRRIAAWGAAVALFLALGSKEVALATPLLMVATELLFRPAASWSTWRGWIDRAAALAPSFLAFCVYLALRVRALEALFALQRPHPMDNPLIDLVGIERHATALGLAARYLGLLVFPVSLSADYSGPVLPISTSFLAPAPLLGTLFLGLLVLLAAWPLSTRGAAENGTARRRVAFAALLFLLPYLVVGNLLFDIGTIFAERLLYLPALGTCLLAGVLLGQLAGPTGSRTDEPMELRRRFLPAILLLLVLGFGIRTWARGLDWRDDRTLFTAAARVQPRSPRAHFIVGRLAADQGDDDVALAAFGRTVELYPAHVPAWFQKGAVHARRGEYDLAEEHFDRAVSLNPEYGAAHFNRALALRRLGRSEEAWGSLRRAVLWDPEHARAWAELGNLALERGHYVDAAAAYRRGIELGRDDLRPRLSIAERRLLEG